jgi:hypothetical protein
MMMGRELRLPDQLVSHPPLDEDQPQATYVQNMLRRLQEAHVVLGEQQWQVRQEGQEEPLLFAEGDLVWLENRRRKGDNPKLQQKFVGPYHIVGAWPNHTYTIKRQGQRSTQNECRLKLYHACPEPAGRAPGTQEVTRRPNMKGAIQREPRPALPEPVAMPGETLMDTIERAKRERMAETRTPLESVPPLETGLATPPVENPPIVEELPSRARETTPTTERPTPVDEGPSIPRSRPRRQTKPPDRYGHNICAPLYDSEVYAEPPPQENSIGQLEEVFPSQQIEFEGANQDVFSPKSYLPYTEKKDRYEETSLAGRDSQYQFYEEREEEINYENFGKQQERKNNSEKRFENLLPTGNYLINPEVVAEPHTTTTEAGQSAQTAISTIEADLKLRNSLRLH